MSITAARKKFMIDAEAGGLMKALVKSKAYVQGNYHYNGEVCAIYKATDDGTAGKKEDAIKKAVRTVVDYGFNLPPGLRFYCIDAEGVQNRAFVRDAGWNGISHITLGPSCLEPGNLDSISNKVNPGFTKGEVTCIHELGHAIHAHMMGEDFLTTNALGGVTGQPTPANAKHLGMYAQGSKKEFVAEVFAATLVGRQLPASVMQEYATYHGPPL